MEEIKDILKEFEENDNLENNDTLTSDYRFKIFNFKRILKKIYYSRN